MTTIAEKISTDKRLLPDTLVQEILGNCWEFTDEFLIEVLRCSWSVLSMRILGYETMVSEEGFLHGHLMVLALMQESLKEA